jgi:histidinol-phosphate/aromatic aminotransferase/cobyric acid decarboxylase-like protein
MGPEPRRELIGLPPVVHGGAAPPGVLDFSTGISPLPIPDEILQAARTADLSRYAHPTALPFRAAAGEVHGISPEQIVAGAGSVELIWALARAFGGPDRAGLVVVPAFGEYEQALRASGTRVRTVSMRPPRFEAPLQALEDALSRAPGAALVFLCRPSNPCLSVAPAEAVERLARKAPGTVFVVDEAYQPLFSDVEPLAPRDNIVVLRSVTKVFALPGLRLGYLFAPTAIARAVQASLPPWNVASSAQAAGAVAARLLPIRCEAIREEIASLRDDLARGLSAGRLSLEGAGGSFLLYRVESADQTRSRLLEDGLMVRSCSSFGLNQHVRIGVCDRRDNEKLISAWRRL